MFVIIIGGGKTGSQLATTLLSEQHQIKIIEERGIILEKLREELPEESIIAGDGSSPTILEEAGIRKADVLAAVTGDDEANLVICSLAKFEFDVPRVISRINNPKNAWLFNEGMGVDVALNQSEILSRLIAEEMSLGDMLTLLKLRKGEYSMVEEKAHPTSLAVGKQLSQLEIPSECVITAIIRKGKLLIPHGYTVVESSDEIFALVHASQVHQLAALLARTS
jgi:trk system potassium uptake protein TrkA